MLVRYCTADALKKHEPVNAFNLVSIIIIITFARRYCDPSCLFGAFVRSLTCVWAYHLENG